jgi:hypothetical protein
MLSLINLNANSRRVAGNILLGGTLKNRSYENDAG